MAKLVNSFTGMNLNLSDMVLPSTFTRICQNMRIIDLDSSTFVMTNIRGTEEKFQITNGYVPIASEQYNGVLYLISVNPATSEVELGSYPSPDYDGGTNQDIYRPLNNLDGGVFRTTAFGYNEDSLVKLVLQPDYDESINMIMIPKGLPPRIVNTKFKNTDGNLQVTAARPGTANSNTYTAASLDKETRLEVFSDQILKIAFGGVLPNGKLKPGNYVYAFYYMTEDFARTELIGQSSICQVAFGTSYNTRRGGDNTEETTSRVVLNLTNIDTDFRYIKIYALYSSGQEGLEQQYLEFVNPLTITGSSMTFTHTGFETLQEVSPDTINTSFYGIDSANTGEQINGYLILGGIQEKLVNLNSFSAGSLLITPEFNTRDLIPSSLPGYNDPVNVYNYMGHFGDESYPFAIVYILPGGSLSPAFPIQGKVFTSSAGPSIVTTNQDNGIVSFPSSNHYSFWKDNKEAVKYLKMDMTNVPQEIKDSSIGFFFVRGERRPWLLAQGVMMPVIRVPNIEYIKGGGGDAHYYDLFKAGTEDTAYGMIPHLDQYLEAYAWDEVGSSDEPNYVVDDFFQLKDGYMFPSINDLKLTYDNTEVENFPTNRWAFIAGEGLLNEPFFVTSLQRENVVIKQLGKGQFRVKGGVQDLFAAPVDQGRIGAHYDMESLALYGTNSFFSCSEPPVYVPAETFATGSKFISRVAFRAKSDGGGSERGWDIYAMYNSYFGLSITGTVTDGTKGATNPQSGNARFTVPVNTTDHAHATYGNANNNQLRPAGWIINIYPSATKPTGAQLYATTDDIVYKQVSPRYAWSELAALGNKVDVFGGDAYICKITRKLNQSGFRNPTVAETTNRKANINQGMFITWWQESKYNLYLRQPVQFDTSELEKRSFFPFRSNGSTVQYRAYRYPETLKSSPGYAEISTIKSIVAPPSLSPAIRNNFFSRLASSIRHIPNAFKNGYRVFLSTNFRDYDADMGAIVETVAHGNVLLVIFEHGVGAASIEDRVLTGRDTAGPVFAEPSSILPPKLQFMSRKVGAQTPKAVIRTPSAVYFMDQDKRKIFRVSDRVESIVDETVSSYLEQYGIVNPRCAYDFKYNEVIFTTDNYTLIFREGRNQFTAFYNFVPSFYASRGNEMYSFRVPPLSSQGAFILHDANSRLIYGEQQDCWVEFVVNESIATDKIFDTIELISNEVRPKKIEVFSYAKESKRSLVINPAACLQYCKIEAGPNPYTDDDYIPYDGKRFVITIPKTEIYNGQLDQWGIGGRMRNKMMIIRITYNTADPVQLMGAITTVRAIQ